MAFPQVSYDMQDALLQSIIALPAQSGTATSASIDLGTSTPSLVGTHADVVVTVPAIPGFTATTGTYTMSIHDSADNVSFAAVNQADVGVGTGTLNVILTGVATTGTAALSARFRLPPTVRRYIRLNIAANASTGTNTSTSATLQVRC